ncbi:MAG: gas vesicle protein [Dehalococcoidia bacterium]|nr:gas vesicle protein [Dehalococcoidia bacterium]
MITAIKAANLAKDEIAKLTNLELGGVRGLSQDEGMWHVMVEMVEKRSIPDAQDILGGYEVIIDEEGTIVSFERKMFRKRGDTDLKPVQST